MRKVSYHIEGSDPQGIIMDSNVSAAVKLFHTIVPWMLNKDLTEIQASSLTFAVRCGFVDSSFQEEYNAARSVNEISTELKLKKDRIDSKVNKVIDTLKKLRLINTRQVHNNYRGSKRYISLNNSEVRKLLSNFDDNLTDYEIDNTSYDIKNNRGTIIVIRKFVRYRIFSLVEAIKNLKEDFNKYRVRQIRNLKKKGLRLIEKDNGDIVELIEIEYKRKLNSKERFIIDRWKYSYDDVKWAVLETLKRKIHKVEYLYKILENNEKQIKKNHEYYNQFMS
ncbi:hypothetical protein KHQ82_05350 [Mycoplasmatota bacterium]|nr:hypothetical protein KHQ82_05350 [Mycoplasmatota bacterium]